jgi:membrane protease YdiL (CAAX protease family)
MMPFEKSPLTEEIRDDLINDGNFVGGLLIVSVTALNFLFTVVVKVLIAAGVMSSEAALLEQLGLANTPYLLVYMTVYTVCMFCPVVLCLLLFRKSPVSLLPTAKVEGRALGFYLLTGLAGCVGANIVASYVGIFLEQFGWHAPESPALLEKSLVSLLLNLISVAVLPAILEELLYRVCILGSLRRYGDGFAIMVSAILFGVIHGGLSQGVFACLVGLVLGYLTVVTGSILPAILVHFSNNAMSVLLQYAGLFLPEQVKPVLTAGVLYSIGIAGGIVLLVAWLQRSPWLKKPEPSLYPLGERMRTLVKAPLMMIAMIQLAVYVVYKNIV